MHILSLKISELNGFVQSELYQKLSLFPVTKHRALSQSANPRALPDDIALIIAYSDEMELLGYIGAFPDILYIQEQPIRIGWNSCWWSHPQKGKPAVMKLFAEMVKAWGENICYCDLAEEGKNFIHLTGRYTVSTYPGYRFFYQFYLARLLPSKFKILDNQLSKAFLRFIDFCFNIPTFIFKFRNSPGDTGKYTLKETKEFSEDSALFAGQFPEYNSTRRGKKDFDWILQYPWILTDKATREIYAGKYFFSHSAESFQAYFLEIRENGQLKGILLLQERDGHYRAPYAFFKPKDIKCVGECLLRHLKQHKAFSFTIYHSLLCNYLKNKKGYIKKTGIVRYSAFPKKWGDAASNLYVQDGDGDAVFC
jgi:hypothetical protein